MSKVDLLVAPCEYNAAKYAVMNWHYSKAMPSGKLVKFGVWEDKQFIGCVLFGRGANKNIGEPYGLKQENICELVRVALCNHKSFVSEILSRSLQLLRVQSVNLVVSYADSEQDHLGIIYQASNWIYVGTIKSTPKYLHKGKFVHAKTADSVFGTVVGLDKKITGDKYKYLYPLTKKMRRQILPLSKPYPRLIDSDSFIPVK